MSEELTDPRVSLALKTLTKLRKDREDYWAGDERMVRRVKVCPEMLDLSPYEVILEYAAGETSWDSVVEELSQWPFTFAEDAEPGNLLSARTIGSWDDVAMAHGQGLITTSEYWWLFWITCRMRKD